MASTSLDSAGGEVVLVTGGSGFIGQHLLKHLLRERSNLGIKEIRSLDMLPFENKIDIPQAEELKIFVGDFCEQKSIAVQDAFKDVNCVFHCAALVSIEYPPDFAELDRVNVNGTSAIVDLCVQHNVKRLVYTSCASVCLVPFKGYSTFTIVINQTESKALTPTFNAQDTTDFDKSFLIPGYTSSKLRGETIVLNSNGALLSNQKDYLETVAIRPPLTYGEGDMKFVPQVFEYLSGRGFSYPRIAGAGGKQQLVYAGNVAWGHLCAYKTLKATPKAIAGLPVFITDDTPINDVTRFIQKMALLGGQFKVNLTFWYLPHFLFFILSFLAELFIQLLYPVTKFKLKHSLRAIGSFTASVLFFNRLRASIHMDYVPLIEPEEAAQQSARWYAQWWEKHSAEKRRK
ncbi:PREDICTED: 3 beta-hydroxysteroid dehydrogenase/Delta 5--_4-isomerase type 2 [Rhagoletis zephyria]|uniref:3 beta-hydroxysteroid dehydrogenase/Delta 5-->4-isomerase type 2 n=1 Tax=Rhagoletis zephyria TaxID=28612 RepID=UPI0008115B71|nr:PREDICTED: 3 beta-hydroxysteroid dehydrogenase/Delta 5-->4-isomerase type 2 [Rhagoletis zephyria]XP_017481114.1 PREDICTED: 3 beta-hydroxysteroid dehydrogenase/Delta 5-->4-isomerase type 2 [Rhagoletis zephyria]XP_017481115.1 PREDICTED: 3 beta-hydroxysteroid dehydrogenase/Delta 5-->4-isomerase type 2 [Rhagoletis zephyria]XP_017481116.1 PREDICTED: 3 beta-hydroxysteroid dehydrogenase/Delta 5-->4-isomerase type 2 [Rhagoletis zephyria]XP_017481117.1 PREDICTED: 3 beta-hydroxysteroid dehydrogenase/D